MEDFIGTIKIFAFGFAPRSWAKCEGQLLAISQNEALFSLLGTTYGGDGRTTFGLPDLRGHVPISQGTAPGFSNRPLGSKGGSESNTMTLNQLPGHTHQVDFNGQNVNANVGIPAVNDDGSTDESENNILANSAGSYAASSAADTTLSTFNAAVTGTVSTGSTGAGTPINNMQPFLTLNYCICLQGLYPPRN